MSGEFGDARREAFIARVKAKRAAAKPPAKSSPVTRRRVAPSVPPGTRAARLKRRGTPTAGNTPESLKAMDDAGKYTETVMQEEQRKEVNKQEEIRARKATGEAAPSWDDERTEKERAEDRRIKAAQAERDAEARKMVMARRKGEKYGGIVREGERIGGPWGTRGAGVLEARPKAEEAAKSEAEVWESRKKRGKARRAALAREAGRQKSIGIRTPAVTKQEVEERGARVERVKRGMRGAPLTPTDIGSPTEKIPSQTTDASTSVRTRYNRRFGGTPPFAGVYPSRPENVSRIETVRSRPKPSQAGRTGYRIGIGRRANLASVLVEPLLAAGIAAVNPKVSLRDVWNYYTQSPKRPTGPMG